MYIFLIPAAIGSAFCIILIAYSGCNAVLATFWMFLGMIMLGAYYSGVMINMLDMNPNYAGTMIGVVDNVAINSVYLLTTLNRLVITDVSTRIDLRKFVDVKSVIHTEDY